MSPKYPRCAARLNDGSVCRTVVYSLKSDDELERRFCRYHAGKAPEMLPPAEPVCDEHDDPLPAVGFDVPAEPESPTLSAPSHRRGSPREELRKLAEASTEQLGRFFQDALNAEQKVWTDCPSCKKRSLVPVPAWAARTRAVELLLEQGFGKPDPAPRSEDDVIAAAVIRHLESLSDKQLAIIAAGGYEDNGNEAA